MLTFQQLCAGMQMCCIQFANHYHLQQH